VIPILPLRLSSRRSRSWKRGSLSSNSRQLSGCLSKAVARDADVKYETARVWAEHGLNEARRDGERWIVNLISLKARKERFAG
jgi:hypothetical protein